MTWRTDKLADLAHTKNVWKQIKFEKQTFSPRFYDLKDIRGNRDLKKNGCHGRVFV